MENSKTISLYRKNHIDKNDERLGQFLILAKRFDIKSALYPGVSFI